jgi:hypothetical protein
MLCISNFALTLGAIESRESRYFLEIFNFPHLIYFPIILQILNVYCIITYKCQFRYVRYVLNFYTTCSHIHNELRNVKVNGICMANHHLHFRLLKCHNLACSYTLITQGDASAIRTNFCPWCTTTKPYSTNVITQVFFTITNSISLIRRCYSMRESLIWIYFMWY